MIDTRLKRFNISFEILARFLQLPKGTSIERVHMSNDYPNSMTVVIRHDNFKELLWGDTIPYISNVIFQEPEKMIISWDITGLEGL